MQAHDWPPVARLAQRARTEPLPLFDFVAIARPRFVAHGARQRFDPQNVGAFAGRGCFFVLALHG